MKHSRCELLILSFYSLWLFLLAYYGQSAGYWLAMAIF